MKSLGVDKTEKILLYTPLLKCYIDHGLQISVVSIPEFLDSGRRSWTLDCGRWTLDCGRWALGSGHWTLSLTVVEQNWNQVSDFA